MVIALRARKLGLFLLWFSLFTVVVVIVTSNGAIIDLMDRAATRPELGEARGFLTSD